MFGTPAGVTPPSGSAAGCVLRSRLDRASCRQGSNAGGGHCTTRRGNAHRTEEREVLYPWHPWFGRLVHIHEVIEKTAGDVFRCSCDDEASGRLLELPAWMFDRAVCAPMQVCPLPFVGVAALSALQMLLSDLAGNQAVGGSSNAPVPGAALGSHGQNRGEAHATGEQASSSASRRRRAVRSVQSARQRQHTATARMGGAPATDPRDADGADNASNPRSRAGSLRPRDEGGAP